MLRSLRATVALALALTLAIPSVAPAGNGAVGPASGFEGITRVTGANRFDTAVRVAKTAFPGWVGVQHVVVASGDDRAAVDSLAAGGLVWLYDAPLLTTSASRSPAELKQALREIVSANTSVTVHVVGGPLSVPQARLAEMAAIVGAGKVERLPYGDRYETARQVTERMLAEAPSRGKTVPKTVLVANGSTPAKLIDALPLSVISARTGAPLVLVGDTTPLPTRRALDSLAPTTALVGGLGYFESARATFKGADTTVSPSVTVLGGANRYESAVRIALHAIDRGWLAADRATVASGLPDGLTGGAMLGRSGYPILLVGKNSVPSDTAWQLGYDTKYINRLFVMGGTGAVSTTAWNDLRMLVDPAVPMVKRPTSMKATVTAARSASGSAGGDWTISTTVTDQYGFGCNGANVSVKTTLYQYGPHGGTYAAAVVNDSGTTDGGGQFESQDYHLFAAWTLDHTTTVTVTGGGQTLSKTVTWRFR